MGGGGEVRGGKEVGSGGGRGRGGEGYWSCAVIRLELLPMVAFVLTTLGEVAVVACCAVARADTPALDRSDLERSGCDGD